MKSYYTLFLVLICISSCSKPDFSITNAELIGEWRSESTFINDKPASEYLNGSPFYSSILGFKEDNFYFFNYSSGEWMLEDNRLTFSNQGVYTILEYSDSLMTIEGEILAGQLYWTLEGIPKDEMILIKEDYIRQ